MCILDEAVFTNIHRSNFFVSCIGHERVNSLS